MRHRIFTLAAAPAAALFLASGCGDPSSEQLIEDATAQVQRAEQEVEEAKVALEREEEELAEAQEEMAEARETLREAEKRLEEARAHVAEVADDAYLFRAVQSALLADPTLEGEAIAARVRDGVVSLEGTVDLPEQKKRAGALASGVPGVKSVQNRVVVGPAGP